jgi:XTP/dITP diphosphohydrolase
MRQLTRGDRLVLATHNEGKRREIAELLADAGIEVISAGSLGLPEPVEDAPDFAGNAKIKALAAAQASGLPALADDSGFQVMALGGAPGVLSARWAGPGKDFAPAFARIEAGLGDNADRRAGFSCVLCMAWPDGETSLFEGRVKGTLVLPPQGESGFGYDPVFIPEGEARTYAQMTGAEKHRTSHRARALAAWRQAVLSAP